MRQKPPSLNKQGAIEQLRIDLVSQIRDGILAPNMPIRSAADLSKLYGISYPTVHRVLTDLVRDGFIVRIQGKGSFVAPVDANEQKGSQVVGVLMRTTGDLFGPMFSNLNNQLQATNLTCVASDPETQTFLRCPASCISSVLQSKPSSLIVEGMADFPFATLKSYEAQIPHLLFIHLMLTDEVFNADVILSDFERGGYLATRHLLDLGHRCLAIEMFGLSEPNEPRWQHARDKLRGCLRACREAGLPDAKIHVFDAKQAQKTFRALLQSPNPPTGLIAFADYEAARLLSEARSLGFHVPHDLSVVGYFNTNWCSRLDLPLTSVSIREDVIARRAVETIREKITFPNAPKLRLLLEPELILRQSTAAPPKR